MRRRKWVGEWSEAFRGVKSGMGQGGGPPVKEILQDAVVYALTKRFVFGGRVQEIS